MMAILWHQVRHRLAVHLHLGTMHCISALPYQRVELRFRFATSKPFQRQAIVTSVLRHSENKACASYVTGLEDDPCKLRQTSRAQLRSALK
jgi:hypothetical protein